jgi:FkbM family methyltransferase
MMIAKFLYKGARYYCRWYEGFSYNSYTNGEARLLRSLDKSAEKVIFDVGANIGDWTKLALRETPSSTVHCFELSKETFFSLKKSVGDNRVKFNNFGLSNINGDIEYKDYGADSTVNTLLIDSNFHDQNTEFEVKKATVICGDDYCSDNQISTIDYLKIDVEGAEHLVLLGFEKMLKDKSIKLIQFEYGYTHGDVHFLMKDFFNFFENLGYVVGVIKPRGVIFQPFNYRLNDFDSGPNFVAIREDDVDLRMRICDVRHVSEKD